MNFRGGTNVLGYVASNKYDNPTSIDGKSVYRIEEENKHYDCMIAAVNGSLLWEVRDQLTSYDIDLLILISPLMDFGYLIELELNRSCKISSRAYIGKGTQIISDEGSTIEIDDYVIIGDGVVIMAMDHSHIHIGAKTCIAKDVCMVAENNSDLSLSEEISVEDSCRIYASRESEIYVGRTYHIGRNTEVIASHKAGIQLGSGGGMGESGMMSADHGKIIIDEHTTYNTNLYCTCVKAEIIIGKDCMFSYYVKIIVGHHRIIETNTGNDITNYTNIKFGNHVWCGVGSTILPGADIEDGCIIGAASLVNKRIPKNCTCAGNPAKVLRRNVEWAR